MHLCIMLYMYWTPLTTYSPLSDQCDHIVPFLNNVIIQSHFWKIVSFLSMQSHFWSHSRLSEKYSHLAIILFFCSDHSSRMWSYRSRPDQTILFLILQSLFSPHSALSDVIQLSFWPCSPLSTHTVLIIKSNICPLLSATVHAHHWLAVAYDLHCRLYLGSCLAKKGI